VGCILFQGQVAQFVHDEKLGFAVVRQPLLQMSFGVCSLFDKFDFSSETLSKAVKKSFDNRGTSISVAPAVFDPLFSKEANKKIINWSRQGQRDGGSGDPLVRTVSFFAATTFRDISFFLLLSRLLPGDYGAGVPPVPIPNTEVKPCSADGTI
jgi:hypothetical protein